MKKTKLVTLLGAISLIGAIGAGSTFAYLTSTTGTVTNTFTVGNVNFDDDPLTGGLSESKVARDENSNLYVDADGTGEWTVKENKYEDLKWYTKIRPYTWQMIHRTHGYLRKL